MGLFFPQLIIAKVGQHLPFIALKCEGSVLKLYLGTAQLKISCCLGILFIILLFHLVNRELFNPIRSRHFYVLKVGGGSLRTPLKSQDPLKSSPPHPFMLQKCVHCFENEISFLQCIIISNNS